MDAMRPALGDPGNGLVNRRREILTFGGGCSLRAPHGRRRPRKRVEGQVGNDGGFYLSLDQDQIWYSGDTNLTITQFYPGIGA